MAKRKSFLLRLDPKLFQSLRTWADDEFRSVNGQIEYLLRDALRRHGRLRSSTEQAEDRESRDEKSEP